MLAARQPTRRFTLLLLDEGEAYIGGWVATVSWPPGVAGNWIASARVEGRFRLASKSLFFEPDDIRIPIVRIPFVAVQQLEAVGKTAFAVATAALSKMKANGVDAPYVFEKGSVSMWTLTMAHVRLEDVLPLIQTQLAVSRLPYQERQDALQAVVNAQAQAAMFDSSRLVDFMEAVQYSAPVTALTPLVSEPGRLVITSARVYFQSAADLGDAALRSAAVAQVAAVVRRRASLRPTGLEMFFMDGSGGGGGNSCGWGSPSAVFSFPSYEQRELAIAKLRAQPELGAALRGGRAAADACASILEAEAGWLPRVTAAWQAGRLTNLDYLLYCNLAAGRSFCDLTQWPVAPWVLSDYSSPSLDLTDPKVFRDLSKPIGALNKERLTRLQERFRDMPTDDPQQPPFLYGTHYSCPGYVMFWLVRAAPGHLLRLQNGRFDTADRLFSSVAGAWDSVTSSAPDVKELIPEFYLPSTDFLTNKLQLALGTKQDGTAVDAVHLPSWAANADDFVAQHRAALESPYVSANLHHWIDLIFGYKQRGKAAEEADNVFHGLTYADTGFDREVDPREHAAMEAQVNEFGQCPKQLFTQPHPPRHVSPAWQSPAGQVPSPAARHGLESCSASGGEGSAALSLSVVATILATLSVDGSGGSGEAPNPSNNESPQRLLQLVELDVAATEETGRSTEHPVPLHQLDKYGELPLLPAEASPFAVGTVLDRQLPEGDAATNDSQFLSAAPIFLREPLPGNGQSQLTIGASSDSQVTSQASPGRQQSGGRLPRMASVAVAAINSPTIAAVRASAGAAASTASTAATNAAQSAVSRLPSLRNVFKRGGCAGADINSSVSINSGPDSGNINNNSGGTAGNEYNSMLQDGPDLSSLKLGSLQSDQESLAGLSPISADSPSVFTDAASPFAGMASAATFPAVVGRLPSPSQLSAPLDGAAASTVSTPLPLRQSDGLTVSLLPAAGPVSETHSSGTIPAAVRALKSPEEVRRGTRICAQQQIARQPAGISALSVLPHNRSLSKGSESGILLSAGQDGWLRTFSPNTGAQLAQEMLGPSALTCVAYVRGRSSAWVFVGAADSQVFVCSGEGRPQGTWLPHTDAVSALCTMPAGTAVLTASWDGSLKVWDLAEGRHPWTSAAAAAAQRPIMQLGGEGGGCNGGIWSASVGKSSSGAPLIFSGGDDGVVSLWDVRSGTRGWQVEVSRDYVAAVDPLPGGVSLVAAAADGRLSLLDSRGTTPLIAQVTCGSPVAACALSPAADCIAAGSDDGRLHLWSFADGLMSQALRPGGITAIGSLTLLDSSDSSLQSESTPTLPAPGVADNVAWKLAVGCEDGALLVVECTSS